MYATPSTNANLAWIGRYELAIYSAAGVADMTYSGDCVSCSHTTCTPSPVSGDALDSSLVYSSAGKITVTAEPFPAAVSLALITSPEGVYALMQTCCEHSREGMNPVGSFKTTPF